MDRSTDEFSILARREAADPTYQVRGVWLAVTIVWLALCAAAAFGLFVGAVIRHEVALLPALLLSLVVFWSGRAPGGYVRRFGTPVKPVMERLRTLRERTKLGDLGRLPERPGAAVWITERGVLTGSGHLDGWDRFAAFSITSGGEDVHRLELVRVEQKDRRETIARLVEFSTALLGCAVAAVFTWQGMKTFGPRDDVLALLFAGLCMALLSVQAVLRWLEERRANRHREAPGRSVFLINARFYSRGEVNALLLEHMRPERAGVIRVCVWRCGWFVV